MTLNPNFWILIPLHNHFSSSISAVSRAKCASPSWMAMMVKPCSLASVSPKKVRPPPGQFAVNETVASWNIPLKKYGEFIAKCWVSWRESMDLFPVNVAIIKSEKSWFTQCCIFHHFPAGHVWLPEAGGIEEQWTYHGFTVDIHWSPHGFNHWI